MTNVSTITINATYAKPAEAPVKQPHHRISTSNLALLDHTLKVAAGVASFWVSPVHTVNGALCGAATRLILGDDPRQNNERNARANHTAYICLTAMTTAFLFATPGPHAAVPLFLGFAGAGDGAFGILRRVTE